MNAEKNTQARTRPIDNPYETWLSHDGQWTWKVLKKYQTPRNEAKNLYARWFCFVTSPFCPEGEMGDVYVSDIKPLARRLEYATTAK